MFKLGNGPWLLTGDDPPSEIALRFWEHRYYPISAKRYLEEVRARANAIRYVVEMIRR